jgi:hypothetical protein
MNIEFPCLDDDVAASAEWDRSVGRDNETVSMKKTKNTTMITFSLGDNVTWTSQAAGSITDKKGMVVAIVQRGNDPMKFHRNVMKTYAKSRLALGGGTPRDHESYLVDVDGKLYWPRVSGLKKLPVRRRK